MRGRKTSVNSEYTHKHRDTRKSITIKGVNINIQANNCKRVSNKLIILSGGNYL